MIHWRTRRSLEGPCLRPDRESDDMVGQFTHEPQAYPKDGERRRLCHFIKQLWLEYR